MIIVDSHCHLFEIKNYKPSEAIVPIVVGYSHGSNKKAAEYRKQNLPIVLGIAPQSAIKEGTTNLSEWIEFIRTNKPNAIGEIGLDYKWAQNSLDVAKERTVFAGMLALADELNLPVVIHSRDNPNKENDVPKDAVEDILGLVEDRRFLMHFYSGNEKQAKRIVEMGGYISIIHLHSKERRKVIECTPLDRLMVESDSPYVGRTPESVKEAITYISEVKGDSADKIADATSRNAMKFFNFKVD